MVMRDSLLPVDDSHLPDMPVRCVKRTGVRMVGFGGLRVVIVAVVTGWGVALSTSTTDLLT